MDNIAKFYADLLQRYEDEAYEGKFGSDWLEEVGEAVKIYAMECASKRAIPTFKGLIEYIGRIK